MTKAKFNFNNKYFLCAFHVTFATLSVDVLVWMNGVTKSLRSRTRVKCPTLYDVRTVFFGQFLFCPYFVFAIKKPRPNFSKNLNRHLFLPSLLHHHITFVIIIIIIFFVKISPQLNPNLSFYSCSLLVHSSFLRSRKKKKQSILGF